MGRLEVLSRAVQRGLGLRRALIGVAMVAALAVASLPATATAATVETFARDNFWEPDDLQANAGDTVQWRFDHPELVGVHDVWLGTGNSDPDREMLSEIQGPDTPPVEREFPDEGEFPFFCSLHSGMTGTITVGPPSGGDTDPPVTTATLDPASPGPGGTYTGPVTVTLDADDGGGSGVASTEYRVDSEAEEDWTAYEEPFTVSDEGEHVVEFRSTDVAGNSEDPPGEVSFTIGGSGGDPGDPPPAPPPALPNAPGAPQTPFVDLDDLPKRLAAADLVRGLRVGAACQGVDGGTVRITVRGRNARKLGLGKKKAVALAEGSAACDQGRLETMLKPKRKAKKALKRLRGSVKAKLELQMTGSNGRAAESETLVLEGKKKRKG